MPVIWKDYSYAVPSFFKSLDDLDAHSSANQGQATLDAVVPLAPRESTADSQGRMLVCHDYKGGYLESPSQQQYTFNFWSQCDTFVYFSHNRITIPPPQWINVSHRQGVKILGVIIFEGTSEDEVLRLITGKLPDSQTGPAAPGAGNPGSLPVSSYYATLLANLAKQRGFDGYLLNIETRGLTKNPAETPEDVDAARALEAWINLLENELKRVVGRHACVSWYDSITTSGLLGYQNEVNYNNVTFFLASSSLFTNYWWSDGTPGACKKYFDSMAKPILGPEKTAHDILMGLDVWGRGTFGGGQFDCYKALDAIKPRDSGLGAAVFAPGWTWESNEKTPGFNWSQWWTIERKLWVGLPDASKQGEIKPITPYFSRTPAPDPIHCPLLLTFSPGVGYGWYVAGRKVMQKETGWTDIDKQTSLGNLLWPKPEIESSAAKEVVPQVGVDVTFDDAFNGGSAVQIILSASGSSSNCTTPVDIWIPIQSVTLSVGQTYNAELVYKLINTHAAISVTDVRVVAGADVPGSGSANVVNTVRGLNEAINNDWVKTTATMEVVPGHGSVTDNIGISLNIAPQDWQMPHSLTLQVGQLSVYPAAPSGVVPSEPRILWADAHRNQPSNFHAYSSTAQTALQSDVPELLNLSWDVTSSFTIPATVPNQPIADPNPPWVLDRKPYWFPVLAYCNIYVHPLTQEISVKPEDAVFVGTNGWDGFKDRFVLNRADLLDNLKEGPIRVYVQGVTDRGQVLPWELCAYVDTE